MSQIISPTVLNPLNKEEDFTFELTVEKLKSMFGSYDAIAESIEDATGRRCSDVTLRRWLLRRTLPPRIAFELVKQYRRCARRKGLNDEDIAVTDFHPWLQEFIHNDYVR